MLYHACLVQNGQIEYISYPLTRSSAIDLVEYWKHNRPIFANSFSYKTIPAKWKKQIEAYIEAEKAMQPIPESDPEALPFC